MLPFCHTCTPSLLTTRSQRLPGHGLLHKELQESNASTCCLVSCPSFRLTLCMIWSGFLPGKHEGTAGTGTSIQCTITTSAPSTSKCMSGVTCVQVGAYKDNRCVCVCRHEITLCGFPSARSGQASNAERDLMKRAAQGGGT